MCVAPLPAHCLPGDGAAEAFCGAAESAERDGSLERRALAFEQSSVEFAGLQAKAVRTSEEDARLKALSASLEQEKKLRWWPSSLNTIYLELEGKSGAPAESAGVSGGDGATQSYLQNTLAKLGPHVMGVRWLLGENHAYAIVVTATSRKRIEFKATTVELRAAAFAAMN